MVNNFWTGNHSITVTTGISGGTISVIAGNACGFSPSPSTLTVGIHNLWVGGTSSDWNIASNWSDNQVASTSCSQVVIPAESSLCLN